MRDMRQVPDLYNGYKVGMRPLQRGTIKAVMRGARCVQGSYKRYEAATRQLHGLRGRYEAATRTARQV